MNPSNQPEPKQEGATWGKNINEALADAGQKAVTSKNDSPKEVVSNSDRSTSVNSHTSSIPTTALPGSGQPDAQAGDDDTDVTISHAQAEVGLREQIAHEFALFMVDEYDTKRVDQTVGELHASLQRLELEFADRVMSLFQADKAVAVVEALARVRNAIKSMQRVVKDHDDQIHDRAVGNAIWHVENEIARLQPPTAGEGESV